MHTQACTLSTQEYTGIHTHTHTHNTHIHEFTHIAAAAGGQVWGPMCGWAPYWRRQCGEIVYAVCVVCSCMGHFLTLSFPLKLLRCLWWWTCFARICYFIFIAFLHISFVLMWVCYCVCVCFCMCALRMDCIRVRVCVRVCASVHMCVSCKTMQIHDVSMCFCLSLPHPLPKQLRSQ
jgi:hypothetical protein